MSNKFYNKLHYSIIKREPHISVSHYFCNELLWPWMPWSNYQTGSSVSIRPTQRISLNMLGFEFYFKFPHCSNNSSTQLNTRHLLIHFLLHPLPPSLPLMSSFRSSAPRHGLPVAWGGRAASGHSRASGRRIAALPPDPEHPRSASRHSHRACSESETSKMDFEQAASARNQVSLGPEARERC